jgi:hypothetical protein
MCEPEPPMQLDLRLKEESADLATYVLNGEWHLLGRPPAACTTLFSSNDLFKHYFNPSGPKQRFV